MRAGESGRLLYFAYGSNMSGPRLAARIDSMRKLGVATLAGHRLAFHKVSHDGSAKCDIAPAPDGRVLGVVFDIAAAEQVLLDRYEGRGQGYEVKDVEVRLADGRTLAAFSYYATRIDPTLLPYDWYRAHVLHGAAEHRLPAPYVRAIEAVAVMTDADVARAARERALYRRATVPD